MNEIRFIVMGEPEGKARPRVTNKGTYTPPRTAEYEKKVRQFYLSSRYKHYWQTEPLEIDIKAYFGVNKSDSRKIAAKKLKGEIKPTKKPDADNIIKIICDALNGVCYKDDAQIVKATVSKEYASHGFVEVRIKEFKEENKNDKLD